MSSITDSPPSPEQLFKFSPYFAHVNKSLASRPAHLKTPDLQRLKTIKPTLHRALATITATQNRTFKNTLTERWAAHGAVNQQLEHILDVRAFAEPLLKRLIKQRHGLDLDVNHIYINLYIPTYLPVIGLRDSGATTWRGSLLDAALHNFELHETLPYAYEPDSGYITRPDELGHYKLRGDISEKMPVLAFTALCRALNLGARYDAHLRAHLGLNDRAMQLRLKTTLGECHHADLKAELLHGVLTGQIHTPLYESLNGFMSGMSDKWLTYSLSVCALAAEGPVIFIPEHRRSIVAYLPHDPLHPIKEYSSIGSFIEHLTARLGSDDYQQFFRRFIPHQHLATYFSALQRTYFHIITDTPNAPDLEDRDFGVGQSLVPIDNPVLDYSIEPITEDLWETLYSRKLARIFSDAKSIAVSTDAEDRKTRQDRLERWKRIGLALFNAAAFVIAPFVPVVGELMLLQMAYQMLDDVYEGVHDWVEGQTTEAFEHLFAVLESTVQAGLFAAGGQIVSDLLPKSSAFVQGMTPVTGSDGNTRLWSPDISLYNHEVNVPDSVATDELGLRHHHDQMLLTLNSTATAEHTLVLEKAEGAEQFTLRHPTRPHAYRPKILHNGEGAWLMEGERPQTWDDATLMRRLGHATDGLSDTELQNLRRLSATSNGVLRRVHMNSEGIPPLLKDSLTRVKLHKQNIKDIEHVRQGLTTSEKSYWLESLPTELQGWPEEKAVAIYSDQTLSGLPHVYGNRDAVPEDTLKISQGDVKQAKLWPLIVDNFDSTQLDALLGPEIVKAGAVEALQTKVADYAYQRREDIFNYTYAKVRLMHRPQARLIETAFTQLPAPATQAILDTASTLEKKDLLTGSNLALRIRNLATELQIQTRIARAQEGLYEEDLVSPDAEKAAINTLKMYTDAISDLKLDVRESVVDGPLRHTHNPEGASQSRIIVRLGPGKYEVYDEQAALLHPASRFYNALQKSLPDASLQHLKSHLKPGQSFKQWLIEKCQLNNQVRTALELGNANRSVALETETLLRGIGCSHIDPHSPSSPLQNQVRALYPMRDEAEIGLITERINTEQALTQLNALMDEKSLLFRELDEWVQSPRASAASDTDSLEIHETRKYVSARIKDSWHTADKPHINKAGRIEIRAVLDFSNAGLGAIELESLNLSSPLRHVAGLFLDDCQLSSSSEEFLNHFPNLRVLSLASNQLERFPPALTRLRRLRQLTLPNNKLVMTREAQDRLNGLTRLLHLDLSNNPLGQPPAIGQMPELLTLTLNRTGITQWPEGLLSVARPRTFNLSLLGNEIATVPDYLPESTESWVVANTRLERQKLDLDNQDRIIRYRQAQGLDPHRTYPPRGLEGSRFWLDGTPAEQALMQSSWDNVEKEHGSQGFFEVISRMEVQPEVFETESDRINYEEAWEDLASKVWRLIDAAHNDTHMREKLFTLASAPTHCADAGAQIFNAMGLEVMAYEYYEAASPARELKNNLITLARGKARLAKIHDIARADVAQRVKPVSEGGLGLRFSSEVIDGVPGTVDEVEVHTGYQARLSSSLGLPWVPNYMVYRLTAGVGDAEFTRAYSVIKEGEKGDGLVNQILAEAPFWETYLNKTYPGPLEDNARIFDERVDWLNQLLELQNAWIKSQAQLQNRDPVLRASLLETAAKLKVTEAEVLTQEPLSDSLYNRIYLQLADERLEVSRKMTRIALAQAKLL